MPAREPAPLPRAARRPRRGPVASLGAGVLALFLVAGCGDDGGEATPTTTTTPPSGAVDLTLGEIVVERAGGDRPLPEGVDAAVLATAQRYVDAAVVEPLLTGEPVEGLRALFTPQLEPRVGREGADRGALTEEGVPRAVADLDVEVAPVPITALVGADGTVVWVVASLDLRISTAVEGGPLTLTRRGDLYVEMARDGRWLIGGYDLGVGRETEDGTTTTTAAAPTDGDGSSG